MEMVKNAGRALRPAGAREFGPPGGLGGWCAVQHGLWCDAAWYHDGDHEVVIGQSIGYRARGGLLANGQSTMIGHRPWLLS
jgi:hypothetical protein